MRGDDFFNVRAEGWEGPAWRRIARYRGFASVGAWLASLAAKDLLLHADAALIWQEAEKRKLPPPLKWKRGRFGVNHWRKTRFVNVEVDGFVSSAFGLYRYLSAYSLAHIPTGHTLQNGSRRTCTRLAAELSLCGVNWQETNDEKVLRGTGGEEARAILERYRKKAAEGTSPYS